MAKPTAAAMYPPRRMFCAQILSIWAISIKQRIHTIKRGKSAVRSHPADTEFAEMFVLGTNVSLGNRPGHLAQHSLKRTQSGSKKDQITINTEGQKGLPVR